MKKFKPPFHINEPIGPDWCEELGIPLSDDNWEVVDSMESVISTHKTKEGAEKGLEAANNATGR